MSEPSERDLIIMRTLSESIAECAEAIARSGGADTISGRDALLSFARSLRNASVERFPLSAAATAALNAILH